MSKTLVSALIHANAALATLVSAMAAEFGGIAETATVTLPERNPAPNPDDRFQPDPSHSGASATEDAAPKRTRRTKAEMEAARASEKEASAPARESRYEAPAKTPAAPVEEMESCTYEELRNAIKPLVEEGRGEDVKRTISKYASNLKELAEKPEHHAAFIGDIANLSY